MSRFGHWVLEGGLPAFAYTADQDALPEAEWDPLVAPRTRRHWVAIGNRRIQAVVDNAGGLGLWDTADGNRWVTAPAPDGSGFSTVICANGDSLTTRYSSPYGGERVIGPTWFRVARRSPRLSVTRTTYCLEGEAPWVLVGVEVNHTGHQAVRLTLEEHWAIRSGFRNLRTTDAQRSAAVERGVAWQTSGHPSGVRLQQSFTPAADELRAGDYPALFGDPHRVVVECLSHHAVHEVADALSYAPEVRLTVEVALAPGARETVWFRFGLDEGTAPADPASAVADSLDALAARLPRATATRAPFLEREVPWHAALLTGGACRDAVIGGHTLDQGSVYSFVAGFNAAARDPLQHALPLVYTEPDLALSVLRNTCAWATPAGDLPYALDGRKRPWTVTWQPSDQNLWALWLAAEYAAATGDLAAFADDLGYHPCHDAPAVPLEEHLRRQFRFFVDGVGVGPRGHVRMRNADWNDTLLQECGDEVAAMIESGESVLNSAMAAWVLPVYAGLCERLGDVVTAAEARKLGETLRDLVAQEWNGRWFRRAYGPGGAIGDEDLWLEVQPWAILCGAAPHDRSRALLATLDVLLREGSPLGVRVRWPVDDRMHPGSPGEGTGGGIWAATAMTLVWAAASVDPDLAWDELGRMSLAAHTAAYPDVWEGTLSGPDCYNSPEASRPGRTWALPRHRVAMQACPVNNLHSHAQPLLAYLRLLGVQPTASGALRVGGGGSFSSRVLDLRPDGSGRLDAAGPVVVETSRGTVRGEGGPVVWS